MNINNFIEEGIAQAKSKGGGLIKIPPGTYMLNRAVYINYATNIEIDGNGSTSIFPGMCARNNYIEGMAHAGIWIGGYIGGYLESPFPTQITVSGNEILENGTYNETDIYVDENCEGTLVNP